MRIAASSTRRPLSSNVVPAHRRQRRAGSVLSRAAAARKLNGVNPENYLKDTLSKIADGHPISRIDELIPLGGHRQRPAGGRLKWPDRPKGECHE